MKKLCRISGKILKIGAGKNEKEMQRSIDVSHLNITPTDATSFFNPWPVSFSF